MVPKSSRKSSWLVLTGLVVIPLTLSCDDTRVVQGECRDVYGADVCTWATFVGGDIEELGVTFPLEAAENVPAEMEMVWPPAPIAVLAFPAEAAQHTGFRHFELNWEHHGHPPATFMEPHFDFHFYTIPSEELESMDCSDTTKPERLPPDYVLPDAEDPEHGVLTGLCVPAMGMHAMRQEELESSEPFAATMLVGYYGGDVVFVEPMISRAKLLEGQSFSLDIPPLEDVAETFRYPTRFDAEFDESSRSYRIVLSGFAAR